MPRLTAPEVADNDPTVRKLIPTEVGDCALGVEGSICSTEKVIKKIADAVGAENASPEQVIETAKKSTGCDSERCVLGRLENVIGKKEVKTELHTRFKIEGPTDNSLLTNTNIDDILKQWQVQFPTFFAHNFNMRNYASYSWRNGEVIPRPDSLATITFTDLNSHEFGKQFKCCACVINSDKYQGPGLHWMALFADWRKPDEWSVEFFNSSGNPPAPEFVNWMVKKKADMEKHIFDAKITPAPKVNVVKVSSIRHQKSKSECGLYSLFYIWARLHGVPYSYFSENHIPDKLMFEFRQHLYEDPSRAKIKVFNWDSYQREVRIEWESE